MTPWTVAHQALLSMDSPGKNIGVGCHAVIKLTTVTSGLHAYSVNASRIDIRFVTKTIYYDYSELWEQIVIHFCIAPFWGEGSAAQIYSEISSQAFLSYRKIKLFTLNHHSFSSYNPRHGFLGKFTLDKGPGLFNAIIASFWVDKICPALCV